MTFLMMLSVILRSVLVMLLSLLEELAYEPESHLRDTVDWGRMWLVDFNAGKTQLVLFDQSHNTSAITLVLLA